MKNDGYSAGFARRAAWRATLALAAALALVSLGLVSCARPTGAPETGASSPATDTAPPTARSTEAPPAPTDTAAATVAATIAAPSATPEQATAPAPPSPTATAAPTEPAQHHPFRPRPIAPPDRS